ncbi:MAG: Bacitracin transporter ATP-binding protein [Bacteroidetes bacterium]|nr:Bacitracin transporter ATP-binding protein [Bacteroidota bacterium]
MPEPIVQLKNLTKKYGTLTAVDGLNLTVEKGEIVGFLGPNGAGKSTTLRMMLTLIKPTTGEIILFGKNIAQERNAILRQIGCIIEKPDFYLYMSARKNLQIFARMSGTDPTVAKLDEMFELVGLKGRDKDQVRTYSHGMKQRLGIAQTLIHDPELIILDEPTTGLDPQGIIDLRHLILRLKHDFNKTVILSSHILNEVELIADSMTIINNGKAIVQGKVSDLMSHEALIVSAEPVDMDKATQIINASQWQKSLKDVADGKMNFHISKNQIPELSAFLSANGVQLYGLQYRRTLEDYFLKLTHK